MTANAVTAFDVIDCIKLAFPCPLMLQQDVMHTLAVGQAQSWLLVHSGIVYFGEKQELA